MQLPTIPPIDVEAGRRAQARQDSLTKPPGALGRLEALSVRLVEMTGRMDWLPRRRAVVVCAGDHGVAAQGVSKYPQAVTAQMMLNFLRGGAAVNVLARQMNARLTVVDAGVAAELPSHPALVSGKVAFGTADMTLGPAMTPEQASQAIQLGLDAVAKERERGLDVLVVGEMGIGNTTAASALVAVFTGKPVAEVTGRGTGLDDAGLARKIRVIERALAVNRPTADDALAKVGGLEIGAMVGLMIGAAAARIPIVIDGLICAAAALVAAHLAPGVAGYLIAGHQGSEPGHRVALSALGLTPLLDLDLRLGEGTGAVLALPLIEAAMRTLQEMMTFAEADVSGSVDAG